MEPLTMALLAASAIKTGTGLYSDYKQGQAMEDAQATQEDEQRRLDAIAQLQRRPSHQAVLKYKMPKGAKVANVVGQLAGLGEQVIAAKAAGGGGSTAAGGQGRLSGSVVDPNALMKPANAYTSGLGRQIGTWQPSYLRQ